MRNIIVSKPNQAVNTTRNAYREARSHLFVSAPPPVVPSALPPPPPPPRTLVTDPVLAALLAGPPGSGVPGAWRMFTLTLPEPPLLRGMRGEFPSSLEEAVSVVAVGVECPGTLREAMSRTPRGREVEQGSSLGSTEAVAEAGEWDAVAVTAAIAAEPALVPWAEDARGLALAAWEIVRPSTNIRRSSWYVAL